MNTHQRKTGRELLCRNSKQLGPSLVDFWRWADSDLLSNALRGRPAEYLVALDCGVADGIRREWLAYDLAAPGGMD